MKKILVVDNHPVMLKFMTNLLEKKGTGYFRNNPVGTGPFVFEDMVENQYIDYRVNRNYWGKRPGAGEPAASHYRAGIGWVKRPWWRGKQAVS